MVRKVNVEQHRYIAQEQEGRKANHGTICPYGVSDNGKRCAWLAGHYDTHGVIAWQLASGRW